jgi:hypothetical protein
MFKQDPRFVDWLRQSSINRTLIIEVESVFWNL